MVTATAKGPIGRRQESVRTGEHYQLAEFLNSHWFKVGMTNEEFAQKFGYKNGNIVSMWRTGKTPVSLERLPDIAELLNVDLANMLPLWVEQHLGKSPAIKKVEAVFKRLVTSAEFPIIKAVRSVHGKKDPAFTADQIEAVRQIVANPDFADFVLEEGKKQELIKEIQDASPE